MVDGSDLLWAVLVDPAGEAARHAYAAWLEADGQDPDRARLIRAASTRPAAGEFVQEVGGLGSGGVGYLADLARSAWWTGYTARLYWSGGFVTRIEMPTAFFLARAADLFVAHPISGVSLTDKRPDGGPVAFRWTQSVPFPSRPLGWQRRDAGRRMTERTSELPSDIWACGPLNANFITAELAEEVLSQACVAYGRRLVGLRI